MKASTPTQAYEKAMKASFPKDVIPIFIPAEDKIMEIPLEFQPMGIACRTRPDGAEEIIVADYFMPALTFGVRQKNEQRVIIETRRINSVAVVPGITTRFFLGPAEFSDKDRAQTVLWSPEGNLWVSRNGDRSFFVQKPVNPAKGEWQLAGKFSLPLPEKPHWMVHSAVLQRSSDDLRLLTIESDTKLKQWYRVTYKRTGEWSWQFADFSSSPPFLYGIGLRPGDGDKKWFVTDFRIKDKGPGLYCEDKLVIPDIYGNGLCFFDDGSALVTRYGYGQGLPGALIYTPANLMTV